MTFHKALNLIYYITSFLVLSLPCPSLSIPLFQSSIVRQMAAEFPWEGRVLAVTNLSYDVRPSDLRDFFAPKGKLLRVDIERGKDGQANGLAFVEFATVADCQSGSELHGTQFQGRMMKCKPSTRPPPELVRFYIRLPDNRPINDHIRARIIKEAREGSRRQGDRTVNEERTDVIDIDRDDEERRSDLDSHDGYVTED
jgi:RNA recognition motif-containing protein